MAEKAAGYKKHLLEGVSADQETPYTIFPRKEKASARNATTRYNVA